MELDELDKLKREIQLKKEREIDEIKKKYEVYEE